MVRTGQDVDLLVLGDVRLCQPEGNVAFDARHALFHLGTRDRFGTLMAVDCALQLVDLVIERLHV